MELYSVEDIAEVVGVKPETVRWWKYRDPAFPPVVRVGRSWGLTKDRLEAWIVVKESDTGARAGTYRRGVQ
ncbi:helix-turn-helix domain-containing protein [Brachybacterium kimchii]|uniref:Helix-turn-helix domain-containing protein n=1 Tax=Brachybacterium kimchii TaxID=2942909 RepID=A0ABY4NDQ0_9MICO|nr:helix-turn-helix domain-containing protein [Brachybacterium kimchii]UQN31790.1 helix-turn-helix domain-containing protein [Brachybacterium kimchii]